MSQAFHIKYRPKSFKSFFGNRETVESIKNDIEDGGSHAFLFIGIPGIGKTTMGRLLASKLGANSSSILEMNIANTRGIDTMREISESAKYGSVFGTAKVFILDEMQQSNELAQNALLKVIEDCPKHCYFILCTTNPQKIIKPLRERCTSYLFKPLRDEELEELYSYICKKEDIKYNQSVVEALIQTATGSPRRLLNHMYKCKGLDKEDALNLLKGSTDICSSEIIDICRMLLQPDKVKWQEIVKKITSLLKTEDAESVRHMMLAYYSSVLKNTKSSGEVALYVNILEELQTPINMEGRQAMDSLLYMYGKIYIGILS
jgi:DNA polymerase III gamma/tau subunit